MDENVVGLHTNGSYPLIIPISVQVLFRRNKRPAENSPQRSTYHEYDPSIFLPHMLHTAD